MGKGEFLGEFEQLVLLAVLRLNEQAYGLAVRREIEQQAGRETTIGAVYATLERLEAKGLATSREGEPVPERGGRAKRYFRVTPAGSEAIERSYRALQSMMKGLAR